LALAKLFFLAKANTKTIAITALKGGANYQLILNLMTLPYGIKKYFNSSIG
jgi:hypothetical protein